MDADGDDRSDADENPRPRSGALCPHASRRRGLSLWSVVLFLLSFTVILILVGRYWIGPGTAAMQAPQTTPPEKATLRAYAALLLVVVLTLSVILLLLLFRVRRFFFPHQWKPHKTVYPDAWAESAKRLQVPAQDAEDEGPAR